MLCYRLFQLSNMSSWKGILQRMNELQFLWLRQKRFLRHQNFELPSRISLFPFLVPPFFGVQGVKMKKILFYQKSYITGKLYLSTYHLPNMKKILWDISNITKKITLKYCTILYKNSIISEAPVIQTITTI